MYTSALRTVTTLLRNRISINTMFFIYIHTLLNKHSKKKKPNPKYSGHLEIKCFSPPSDSKHNTNFLQQ